MYFWISRVRNYTRIFPIAIVGNASCSQIWLENVNLTFEGVRFMPFLFFFRNYTSICIKTRSIIIYKMVRFNWTKLTYRYTRYILYPSTLCNFWLEGDSLGMLMAQPPYTFFPIMLLYKICICICGLFKHT